MAVADVIGKQVFNMIKNSGRVQESVLNMKDKIVKESLNTLKKSGIDPAALPFDPIAVLNGDVDPNSITIPDVVCSVPPIPPDKIEPAIGAINQYKANLTGIIENYTTTCCDCFGSLGECTVKNCFMDCIGGDTPPCETCISSHCDDSFNKCSGLQIPKPK